MDVSLGKRKRSASSFASAALSPPPASPEPNKAEVAAARRRERAAERREAAIIAAQDRLLFGVPIEQIIKDQDEEEPDAYVYCICQKPDNGHLMVECSGDACKVMWFHAECVDEEAREMRNWLCPACKKDKTIADLLRSGNPGSLSHEEVSMIVPPGEVLRAAAGDVYGLSSWKEDWMLETFGEEAMKPVEEEWDEYNEYGDWEEGQEYDEDEKLCSEGEAWEDTPAAASKIDVRVRNDSQDLKGEASFSSWGR